MEPNEDSSSGSTNNKGNFLCRQSSSRWTPTTDQIRILRDLYYNNGIRSPSAEQIQRITARLRQYGKIEGKNVFYWFQNHKARDRQKKRFTADMTMQRGAYTSISPGVCSSSSSSPGVLGVGQMGTSGYGSVLMEKSFGDCSISGGGGNGVARSISNNLGYVGVDPYCPTYSIYDKRRLFNGAPSKEDDQKDEEGGHHGPVYAMETLPLFPMHDNSISGFCSPNSNSADWPHYYTGYSGCIQTSLELSLNSYAPRSPDSS
ncbi:hypothetical protein NE237_022467 [Protea cynaroides]|uniref:Homeobox domain-containing protein n=1 Tax=Protea cynaroides TaxID=273540 RepID=A0A9Q0HD39_9MAGN|nr:hypothetical protein NE237_022467 [Protea cynaroides]